MNGRSDRMVADAVARLYAAFARHRRWVLAGLVAAIGISTVAITRVPFDNTIDSMLPAGPARDTFVFLREARFSSTIVISLEDHGTIADREQLLAAADR